jgi:hypothetical protein
VTCRVFAKPYNLDEVITELDNQIVTKSAVLSTQRMRS